MSTLVAETEADTKLRNNSARTGHIVLQTSLDRRSHTVLQFTVAAANYRQ